jgi:2-polyprenyl-6-methoxyphenol hydroxylase-like FAD-dependent oxidoreductase
VGGVIAKPHGEPEQRFYADVVVGADGRWSTVARKVDAPLYNTHDERPTALYYAYWRDVAPYDLPGPMMLTHGTMDGVGYLMMDSADGTTAVVVEGFADILESFSEGPGEAEATYYAMLQNAPRIWARVKDAQRATSVRGIKDVPNYYRQPAGLGWALVGDAVHHKDPLGGQGIYDAVFTARAFAASYLEWRSGKRTWAEAMHGYKQAIEDETLPVYHNTLAATRNFEPQGIVQRVIGRWACENPAFIEAMVRVPARMIVPTQVATAPLLAKTVVNGMMGDARRLMTGEPSPAAIPPLPVQRAEGERYTESSAPRLGCLGWLLALPAIMLANAFLPGRRR